MHRKSFSVNRRNQTMGEPHPKKLSSRLASFAHPALKQPQDLFTFVAKEEV
jgi:hypothetical protein